MTDNNGDAPDPYEDARIRGLCEDGADEVAARRVPDSRRDRMLRSPQWRGRSFGNSTPVAMGFKPGVERPSLRELLCGTDRQFPVAALPMVDPVPHWRTRPRSGLRITRLGHSTLLVEMDGARILTDPVWGERASPLPFAGPRRFHPPPASIDALPPLDAIIISHDHYDHLDRPTIRQLRHLDVPLITSLGVGTILEQWGIAADRITELDWWESATVRGLGVTAAPAQHFSGRGVRDRNATLWSSFLLRGPHHSFYYGADSGLNGDFPEIASRLGPFDAIALEIGAFHPAWGDIHMGPAGAIEAWRSLGGVLLPIHWGTFNLAVHPWDEPADTVVDLAASAGATLLMPRFGEPVEPDAAGTVDRWWSAVAADRAADVDDAPDVPLEEIPD
ncbi:MAG TPA: MBL fold metallo-hydrolase [Gemmatimonadales bacterium]|nr:MBL fold metallo-hydrolase [Gemmatimonadales bacterium]